MGKIMLEGCLLVVARSVVSFPAFGLSQSL